MISQSWFTLIQHQFLCHHLKNSIGDARTPQLREIVFNSMRYRRSETVQISGDCQSKQCQLCKGSNNLLFMRCSLDKILKLKVTTPRSKSNQGHIMTLHTYTPKPMSLASINCLHITVSKIKPGQTFPGAHPTDRPSEHNG